MIDPADIAAAEDADPLQTAEEAYLGAVANFDRDAWDPASERYGVYRLCRIRELMLPIEQPDEILHLKKLNCPRTDDTAQSESVVQSDAKGQPRGTAGTPADRKGKGKGKDKMLRGGGRLVPEMGRTQAMSNWQEGQWWRNIGVENLDVIIRDQCLLVSPEIGKIHPGHYLQQAGPVEVFVEGQARGLQRMPVQPRGWVTVDASAVGGPRYLEPVRAARWKVAFSSGSGKGDIVVRDSVSLESEEAAVLVHGSVVEQTGPQEVLKDGIIRMPISFSDGLKFGKHQQGQGWVTCDASSQGGPVFFEPCQEDNEQVETAWVPDAAQAESGPGTIGLGVDKPGAAGSWANNRTWRVVNLGADHLPVVTRAEGYPPGANGSRAPPDDIVVRWLGDGDQVEQVGHSKKTRGFMVMPIRFLSRSENDDPVPEGEAAEGWVTRRMVDKVRDSEQMNWFEEVRPEGQEARRPRNRKGGGDAMAGG